MGYENEMVCGYIMKVKSIVISGIAIVLVNDIYQLLTDRAMWQGRAKPVP